MRLDRSSIILLGNQREPVSETYNDGRVLAVKVFCRTLEISPMTISSRKLSKTLLINGKET